MSFPNDFLPTHSRKVLTVVEPGTILERGKEVQDWSVSKTTEISGCIAYPGSADADWERASALTIDFTVCIPADQVLPLGNFRARVEGETGEFVLSGDVKRWVFAQRFDAQVIELSRRRDGA
jgi:hypothetical protein